MDVDPDSRLAQHEIFGPVLAVHSFQTKEEALAIANNTVFGLGSSVWNADLSRGVTRASGPRCTRLHPLVVSGFRYRRVKDDVRDAGDLTELLRMYRLPRAWSLAAGTEGFRSCWATELLGAKGWPVAEGTHSTMSPRVAAHDPIRVC